MNKKSFHFLKQREILDILIGDKTIAERDGYKVEMPYLSGGKLFDRMRQFGFENQYPSGSSRWNYMKDLLDFAIREQKESSLLSYWFSREHFVSLTALNDSEKIAVAHKDIVESILSAINSHLFFGGNKLVKVGNNFFIVSVDEEPIFELPTIKNIEVEYIRSLQDRCAEDLIAENFDSVITKSRTLIEEVLFFILEKNNIEVTAKGDIKKLYAQFKTRYNMNTQKGFGERINKLLSGLETILQAIAEMRNMNSDAHGVGQNRITIKKRDAQLVINTAIIFSEYLLETYENHLSKYSTLH